ncbi:MAG: hypothetical protein H0T72_02735, partial [Chloroflexia bacterium]|nr:hypothetical protein [Chloroflexia bacterium]
FAAETSAGIVLENDRVRLELDPGTGGFRRIDHLTTGLSLLGDDTSGPPWRIELAGEPEWTDAFDSFQGTRNGKVVTLNWTRVDGIAVQGEVSLEDDEVVITVSATVPPGLTLDKIEYPILHGLGDLHDTATPWLAHPQATGFLFRRPSALFQTEPFRKQGLRYSPYPEGFNGSSMQFFTYYAEDIGGFLVSARDGRGMMKWLNVYKAPDGRLEASLMHQAPDLAPGNGYAVPYPVAITVLDEGSWYAGADRYKKWAVQQEWTRRGTLAELGLESSWLHRSVGYATFGINAAHDRSGWLDRFHELTGLHALHILGVNWPKRTSGYGRQHPGGHDDWFPAQFSPENIAAIERNGDWWAPFTFDLLLALDGTDQDVIAGEQLQLPDEKYSFDAYNFRFCCPATETGYLPALSAWRDEKLVRDHDIDALYYDISANNVLMACRNPDHGHPVGGGDWMVEAYRAMYQATSEATSEANGAPVPLGTEMVNEVFLPEIDYYQARAEGGLLASFEGEVFREWVARGEAEKIPLFAWVYHEYGPVRLDGWGKPSRESGPLFYWVAARVVLWGGLFELNYEFSPLEALDGVAEDPAEHYAFFQPSGFEIDRDKIDFVRQLGELRVGAGNPYLVFGTMLRPLPIVVDQLLLKWTHHNRPHHEPFEAASGTHQVPGIFHSAWRAPDGSTGLFFVNLHDPADGMLAIDLPLSILGDSGGALITVTLTRGDGSPVQRSIPWRPKLTIDLPPRAVLLIEFPGTGD